MTSLWTDLGPLDAHRRVVRIGDAVGIWRERTGEEDAVLQRLDASRPLLATLCPGGRVDVVAYLSTTVRGADADARAGQRCVLSIDEAVALLRAAPDLQIDFAPDLDRAIESAHRLMAALFPLVEAAKQAIDARGTS